MGELASTCRVIAPDLPGFGESDKPRIANTLEYYTQFLKRFTEALDLGAFSLGGLSLGGQISLNFVLKFPCPVMRLVLVGSAGLHASGVDHDLVRGDVYDLATAPCGDHGTRVAGHLDLQPGAHQGSIRVEEWHRLALHVRAH